MAHSDGATGHGKCWVAFFRWLPNNKHANYFALRHIMLHYDFSESIGCWLTLATHTYHRAVSDELAPHGITYRQSMVLGWLAHEGELSQTDLASKMMVEPPTLVGILDRMERDGWITRHNCPSDRRKKIIRANPGAEPVWDKIVECAVRVRRRAIEGMSESDLATLKRLLGQVQTNLKPGDNGTSSCRSEEEVNASVSQLESVER
jgi:MarR family transcriptional regulator, transcriptional regulator for hemolysin